MLPPLAEVQLTSKRCYSVGALGVGHPGEERKGQGPLAL